MIIPSIRQLWDHIWNTVSSLRLPRTLGSLTYWSMFNGGPSRWLEGWSTWLRRGEGELDLLSLQKRRQRWDIIAIYKSLVWWYRKNGARVLSEVHSERTRGNGNKLKCGTFWLDIRKAVFFFKKKNHNTTGATRHCRYFTWSYSITQDSVGQSLDQPSLVGPALAVSLDLGDLQYSLLT